MKPKPPRSFRLSPEALRILAQLSKKLGVPKTSVVELALREKAEREAR